MTNKWSLTKKQFFLLSTYSAIFPISVAMVNTHQAYSDLISVIGILATLPFLVLLGPLLMLSSPFYKEIGVLGGSLICWFIIFIQAYLAFIYSRKKNKTV